jgi:hypothetical protein
VLSRHEFDGFPRSFGRSATRVKYRNGVATHGKTVAAWMSEMRTQTTTVPLVGKRATTNRRQRFEIGADQAVEGLGDAFARGTRETGKFAPAI